MPKASVKAKAPKKVIVIRPLIDTGPHAIKSINEIETACATSASFQASPRCQGTFCFAQHPVK